MINRAYLEAYKEYLSSWQLLKSHVVRIEKIRGTFPKDDTEEKQAWDRCRALNEECKTILQGFASR